MKEGEGGREGTGGRRQRLGFIINMSRDTRATPRFLTHFPLWNIAAKGLGQTKPESEASQSEMAAVRIRHTG